MTTEEYYQWKRRIYGEPPEPLHRRHPVLHGLWCLGIIIVHLLTIAFLFGGCIAATSEEPGEPFTISLSQDSAWTYITLHDMRGGPSALGDTLRRLRYPVMMSADSALAAFDQYIATIDSARQASLNHYDSLLWTSRELRDRYQERYAQTR